MTKEQANRRHWRSALTLTLVLLAIWLIAGPVLSILLAGWLNQWSVGGVPLGFWMAQQGSIVVFVVLILVYAVAMNALERRYRRDRENEGAGQ